MLIGIRKRQSKFFEHVVIRRKLEYVVTKGKLKGKRDRRRPGEMMLSQCGFMISSNICILNDWVLQAVT